MGSFPYRPPKIDIFFPRYKKRFFSRGTKNQKFLSRDHPKSRFSLPVFLKIIKIISQYFLSPDHQKSIYCLPGSKKVIKIQYFLSPVNYKSVPRITKNNKVQYFLSPGHYKSRFSFPRTTTNHQKSICPFPRKTEIN